MKENLETAAQTAAQQAASAPGLRMTIGGSAAAIGSGSAHWLGNITDWLAIAGVLIGIAATIYGLYRQQQDHERKQRLEARQIALYEARMELLRRGLPGGLGDNDPGE